MYQIYFLLLFSSLLFSQGLRGTKSDYWIIENPAALVIYNQYEQRLAESEKHSLPGYSAWRILAAQHILSDQFTLTAKTEFNHRLYFIQLIEDEGPVNKSRAGKIDVIKNARIEGDTLRVTSDGRISIERNSKLETLSQGVLLERLFKHRNKFFVRDLSSDISGWIGGNLSAHVERYVPEKTDLALERQLFSRVNQIFTSYNTRLEKLFGFLNTQHTGTKPSPTWLADKSSSQLKYTLSPATYRTRFQESQSYLVQELKDLLYGSTYQVSATDGQIIISKSFE
jgi:hypothetical protein